MPREGSDRIPLSARTALLHCKGEEEKDLVRSACDGLEGVYDLAVDGDWILIRASKEATAEIAARMREHGVYPTLGSSGFKHPNA